MNSRIRSLGMLALALFACSRQPATPAAGEALTAKPVEPVPIGHEPPALPDLERERLDALFDAAQLVTRSWPLLAANETCILLIAQRMQWVVHCDQAPSGFVRAAGTFRDRPVFAHEGSSFEVSGQVRSTRALLAQTPAAAHVFAPSNRAASLPAQHPWLLLGTLEALREFHPAFGPATTESWLSVAIHEFIHIHQLRQPEFAEYVEPIDTHALEPSRLGALYERDEGFRTQVQREYQQLTAAAEAGADSAAARAALRTWLHAYRKRSAGMAKRPDGQALLRDEQLFTYLEGVARFVESDFLRNAAQHPASGLLHDPQFHHFEAFMGYGYRGSPNRQLDTQYYYAIGYHVCELLERVDPTWKQRVHAQPGWLIGMVENMF